MIYISSLGPLFHACFFFSQANGLFKKMANIFANLFLSLSEFLNGFSALNWCKVKVVFCLGQLCLLTQLVLANPIVSLAALPMVLEGFCLKKKRSCQFAAYERSFCVHATVSNVIHCLYFLTCLCSSTHICPSSFPLSCIWKCLEQARLLRKDNTNQEELLFLTHHFRSLVHLFCVYLLMTFSNLPVYGSYSLLRWLHLFLPHAVYLSFSALYMSLCFPHPFN